MTILSSIIIPSAMYELVVVILAIIIFTGFYIFILGFMEDNDKDDDLL